MSRRNGIADEHPSSLGGWLFADLFLVLIVVGFSSLMSKGDDRRPVVTTEAATAVSQSSAVLNGSVIANKQRTDVEFEWGKDPELIDGRRTKSDDSPVSGAERDTHFQRRLEGLDSRTTYYFRAIAANESGKAVGRILSFETGGDQPCDPDGAKFIRTPFEMTLGAGDVPKLMEAIRQWTKDRELTVPKVAVAVIRGWTPDRDGSGSKGQKNARDFYRRLEKADRSKEFFYEDSALEPLQNSALNKNQFTVVLYFVDLADRCE